jgi:hypothetical protein
MKAYFIFFTMLFKVKLCGIKFPSIVLRSLFQEKMKILWQTTISYAGGRLVCKTPENSVMNCENSGSCAAAYTDLNFLGSYSTPIFKCASFKDKNQIRSIL